MRPPYAPDASDEVAYDFINKSLRLRDEDTWKHLLSDEYVVQTNRILEGMKDTSDTAFAARKGTLEVARQKRRTGEVSPAEYTQLLEDYETWKLKALHFQDLVVVRLRQARPAVRRLTGDDRLYLFEDLVRSLALAIVEHQREVEADYEPTVPDRMLWLRLNTLRYPSGETVGSQIRKRAAG